MRPARSLHILTCIAALSASFAASAIVASASHVDISSAPLPVAMTSEQVTLLARVSSDSVPNGTLDFLLDSLPIPGCTGKPIVPETSTSSTVTCDLNISSAGTHTITGNYLGDPYHAPATGTFSQVMVESLPSLATVDVGNPYGPFTVTGATQNGNNLINFTPNVVIQLGSLQSTSPFIIDFDHLNLAAGSTLSFRAGAPGQSVSIYNWDTNPSIIAGALSGLPSGAIDPPTIDINSPSGMSVRSTGRITNYPGLRLDYLAGSFYAGKTFTNYGYVDGGKKLEIYASDIHGSGDFAANDLKLHTYGHANNPTHGNDFLSNYLNLKPGTGVAPQIPDFNLTLNGYGTSPQTFNLKLNGSASMWMPSQWPVSLNFPPNNAVVAPGEIRPAGVPNPAYGGGSLLIQATGALQLFNGGPSGTHDFIFPGAIVLISGMSIDLKGTTLNQGWANKGLAFQGIFLEAPIINDSSGHMNLYGNTQNWINMSTMPIVPVSAFTLQTNQDGSASYLPSDGQSTHLNAYSVTIAIAIAGGCWICAVNTTPVDMSGPH